MAAVQTPGSDAGGGGDLDADVLPTVVIRKDSAAAAADAAAAAAAGTGPHRGDDDDDDANRLQSALTPAPMASFELLSDVDETSDMDDVTSPMTSSQDDSTTSQQHDATTSP